MSRGWAVLPALALLVVTGCGGSNAPSVRVEWASPELQRLSYDGTPAAVGYLTLRFAGEGVAARFANAGVDWNRDGRIESYSAGGAEQEEWVLRNALLVAGSSEYTVLFDLADPAIVSGVSVPVRLVASPAPLSGGFPMGGESGTVLEVDVVVGVLEQDALIAPGIGGYGGAAVPLGRVANADPFATPADDLTRGEGGSEALLRRGLPDAKQGFNTCVGHSVANSLSWLARKCGFESKLGAEAGTAAGVEALAGSLIESYDAVDGLLYDERGVFRGVNNAKLLEGKNHFTRARGLPITTRVVSRAAGRPLTFATISQAMKDGCDVEVFAQFLDPDTNSRLGLGHAVTVAGYSTASSGKSLTFHDPGTDSFNDRYDISETEAGNVFFPFVFEGRRATALIDHVMIECCVTPTPTPVVTSSPAPPTPSPSPPPPTPAPTGEPTPAPTSEPTPAATQTPGGATATPAPTATPQPTATEAPRAPGNCCEFAAPQGCASGPNLTLGDCQGLPGFLSFRPGQVCTGEPGDCVPIPTPTPPGCSGAGGSWTASVTDVDDPAGHREFVGEPIGDHQVTVNSPISITGTSPVFVPVMGEVLPGGPGVCSFVASGQGVVAGFPDIEVTMEGSFVGDTFSGFYEMGSAGGLPQGEPIRFFFSGARS